MFKQFLYLFNFKCRGSAKKKSKYHLVLKCNNILIAIPLLEVIILLCRKLCYSDNSYFSYLKLELNLPSLQFYLWLILILIIIMLAILLLFHVIISWKNCFTMLFALVSINYIFMILDAQVQFVSHLFILVLSIITFFVIISSNHLKLDFEHLIYSFISSPSYYITIFIVPFVPLLFFKYEYIQFITGDCWNIWLILIARFSLILPCIK